MHGLESKERIRGRRWLAILLAIVFVMPSSAIIAEARGNHLSTQSLFSMSDSDGDGLTDREEEEYGTDPLIPDMYVRYRDYFFTEEYYCWINGSISFDDIVLRRGTFFTVHGAPFSEISVQKTRDNLEPLKVVRTGLGSWTIHIDKDGPIGIYNISLSLCDGNPWERNMTLYVIFNPFDKDLSLSEIKAYAYDETGDRDTKGIAYPDHFKYGPNQTLPYSSVGGGIGNLIFKERIYEYNQFEEHIFKISMEINNGESNDFDASNKTMWAVSNIIYYRHPDGRFSVPQMLSDISLQDISKARDGIEKPLIEGQCLDYANMMVALLRSVGIASRVVQGIVNETYGLSYHQWTEVYIKTPVDANDHWYAFDANDNIFYSHDDALADPIGYMVRKGSIYGTFWAGIFVGSPTWECDGGSILYINKTATISDDSASKDIMDISMEYI